MIRSDSVAPQLVPQSKSQAWKRTEKFLDAASDAMRLEFRSLAGCFKSTHTLHTLSAAAHSQSAQLHAGETDIWGRYWPVCATCHICDHTSLIWFSSGTLYIKSMK